MPEKPKPKYNTNADGMPIKYLTSGSNPVTPEQRALAIAYLNYYLNKGNLKYGKAKHPQTVGAFNEDPIAEIAILDLLKRYPNISAGVTGAYSGGKLAPQVLGQMSQNPFYGGADIILNQSGSGDPMEAWNTMRHEMAHVLGYPDISNNPDWDNITDAYDMDRASRDLHRDIQLPPSPIKKIKSK